MVKGLLKHPEGEQEPLLRIRDGSAVDWLYAAETVVPEP